MATMTTVLDHGTGSTFVPGILTSQPLDQQNCENNTINISL